MRTRVKKFVPRVFLFLLFLLVTSYWDYFRLIFWILLEKINFIKIYYLYSSDNVKYFLRLLFGFILFLIFYLVILIFFIYKGLANLIVDNKIRKYNRHKANVVIYFYLTKSKNSNNFTQLEYLLIYHNFLFWEEKIKKASLQDRQYLVISEWLKDEKAQTYVKLLKIKTERYGSWRSLGENTDKTRGRRNW